MTRRTRWIRISFVVVAALALVGVRGDAGEDEVKKDVQAVADLVAKGDQAGAKALAKKVFDKHEDALYYAMLTMKPRDKGGFGVGAAGKVMPDGIEKKVQDIALNGIKDAKAEGPALEEMAQRIQAIALIGDHYKPAKMLPLWKNYNKGMQDLSLELAKVAKSGNADQIKGVVSKMDANCNQCHEKFR